VCVEVTSRVPISRLVHTVTISALIVANCCTSQKISIFWPSSAAGPSSGCGVLWWCSCNNLAYYRPQLIDIQSHYAMTPFKKFIKKGLADFVEFCRGSPRLCILPFESTVGSWSVTCDCCEHNIGGPKFMAESRVRRNTKLSPNCPENDVFWTLVLI
jgi:hypothetical protein